MARLLFGFCLLIFSHASLAEIAANNASDEQGSMAGMIGFGVLFVALCAGFVWLVIRNDRKRKAEESKQ